MTVEERLANNEKAISDITKQLEVILDIAKRLEKIAYAHEIRFDDMDEKLAELENKPKRRPQ